MPVVVMLNAVEAYRIGYHRGQYGSFAIVMVECPNQDGHHCDLSKEYDGV